MINGNDIVDLMEQYKQQGGDIGPILSAAQLLASTGKTSLGLNQWVKSDKPQMEDFNEDNRIIDRELARLDDNKAEVESGSWTPVITSGAATIRTPAVNAYSKIGRKVTLYFRADIEVTDRSSTAQLLIGGLPYPYDFVKGLAVREYCALVGSAGDLGTPMAAVNPGNVISFRFMASNKETVFSGATWGPATQAVQFVISYDTNQ